MIRDVLHAGFTVRDIGSSIDWYTQILGLELVHRQRSDNAYIRQLVGVDDAVLEVAQLTIPGWSPAYSTHVIELIQYVHGGLSAQGDSAPNQLGATHLAFIVDDIHERYEAMSAAGVDFVNPPVRVTEGANEGGYACYLRDPDGIMLELMQLSPARATYLGIEGGSDP